DKNCYLTFTTTGIRITYQTRTIFEALYIDSVLEFPNDEDFLESVEITNINDEFPFILNLHRFIRYLNLMDYRIRITYDSINKAICLDQLKLNIVLYTFRVPASLESGRNYREPQLSECNVDFEFPPCWKITPFVEYMGYYDKKKIMLSANNKGVFKLSSPEDEMSMEFINCTNHQ
ncbi:11309_t:CDS:2, partial [Dentiscutata erythropus]